MKKIWPYILPSILLVAFVLSQLNVLHISILKIKSHELKVTNLSYNWIPGEVYSGGETVSRNNYESAHIGILPDYKKDLQDDLDLIAANRDRIDYIDLDEHLFYSDQYQVKLCLDHKRLSTVDSALFKRIAYLDILGQFELWDAEGTKLLKSNPDRKWWIRDSIIFKGIASKEFYENKLNEIWLAQLSERVTHFVENYDVPQQRDLKTKRWIALVLYSKAYDPRGFEDIKHNYWTVARSLETSLANYFAALNNPNTRTLTSQIVESE